MGIYTDLSVVVILAIWAPNSLEVEHVEIHVNVIFFNHLHRQFVLAVSKGAELLVLTLWSLPWLEEGRAELGFVFVWMIEFFNSVMCFVAGIAMRTT